ncbi:MAG: hypothetical protein ACRDQZ_22005, partial [Mycobacteriales bacterium]
PITDTLAFVAAQRDSDLTLREWIASLLHPQHMPLFSWRDPGPSAASIYHMSARTGRRLLQRRRPDAPAVDAAVA